MGARGKQASSGAQKQWDHSESPQAEKNMWEMQSHCLNKQPPHCGGGARGSV